MTEKEKILIVDDKKQNLLALRKVLAELDVEIIEVTNGNDALAATLDYDFAVAILDVMMPGMDGYELAGYLRGDVKTRNLPIIFLTAVYSEEERIFKGYEVGAVDYIVKPYNPAVLFSKVRVFLELKRARTELAQKIIALTESEQRFKSLVMTMPDIVYRIDAEGRFTYLNAAVQTLGYTPEELLGTHFSKILYPIDVKNVSRKFVLPEYTGKSTVPENAPKLFDERRTGERITKGLEVRLMPRKGGRNVPAELHSIGPEVIVVEINSAGIYSGEQKTMLLGSVGVIRDITDRKRTEEELDKYREHLEEMVRERTAKLQEEIAERRRAEAALSESERYFRSLMYSLHEDIVVIDRDYRITDVNNACEKTTGRTRDDIIGRRCYEVLHGYDEPCEKKGQKCLLEEVFKTGKSQDHMQEQLNTHSRPVYVDIVLSPLKDGSGKVTRVVKTIRDVTDIIEAREQAQSAHEQLSMAIRSGNIGIWDWDLVAGTIYYSPQWKAQLGYVDDEIHNVYDEWETRLHPDDREATLHWLDAYKKNEEEKSSFEFRLRHKDGSYRWIYSSAQKKRDASGKPVRMMGCHTDISERKQEEEQREKLHKQFVGAQRMESIGRLAGGIAHDFNNLLSVIQSYTEFALESVGEEDPLRENLRQVMNAGERATALTRQLLAFSRKQMFQPMPLDLNRIVAGIEKMLRRIMGEDIDLIQSLAPDLGVVMADPGQVEQVIMNLVVNARDAMPEGGKLTIETANVDIDQEYAANHVDVKLGPYVMLAVTDTGCGMDELTMASIFEPFFTTKPKDKGTGLGLSTVYGIVKQSGGSIWVYSELNKGTTFKIYLPRELTAVVDAPVSKTAAIPSVGTETILIVEDEEQVRRIAKTILSKAGYSVLTAANGNDALLSCETHPGEIHLVLTDVVMPGMSGRDFAQRLLQIRPQVKILYMSGYTDSAIVNHGELDPGTRFIGKPFAVADLRHKVRMVLDEDDPGCSEKRENIVQDHFKVKERTLSADALRALSPDLANELRKAVVAARYDEMIEIVERIRLTTPDVAGALHRMVEEFDYDGILDLLGR